MTPSPWLACTLSVAIKSVGRKFLCRLAQCNVCIITIVNCKPMTVRLPCMHQVSGSEISVPLHTHCNFEHDYTAVCTIMIRFTVYQWAASCHEKETKVITRIVSNFELIEYDRYILSIMQFKKSSELRCHTQWSLYHCYCIKEEVKTTSREYTDS